MSSADTTRALTVKHTYYKVIGWVGVVFFMFWSMWALREGDGRSCLLLLGFVALSSYIILTSGSMQVDSDSIRYYLPWRSYQIKWNEVRYIEVDRQDGTMVFVGENKKLVVNGPSLWTGKDKLDMARLIAAKIDKYAIEIRRTEKAPFRLSRNTKTK